MDASDGGVNRREKACTHVNGKLSGSVDVGSFITANPQQGPEIGADDGSNVGDYTSPNAFTGLIDDVTIFHGTVTSAAYPPEPGFAGGSWRYLTSRICADWANLIHPQIGNRSSLGWHGCCV